MAPGSYAAMPGWRRPGGTLTVGVAERERTRLCDAVLQCTTGGTVEQIHADVCEEYGSCTLAEVKLAITELAGDGEIVRGEHGWVRA